MRRKPLYVFGVLVAVFAAGCSSNGSGQTTGSLPVSPSMPRHHSASKYIKNVIVIVQENRSFENFFAGYPGANAPLSGCAAPTPSPSSAADDGESTPGPIASGSGCPRGDKTVALHQITFETHVDPDHDWHSSMVDWDNGRMDGFSAFGLKHGPDWDYAYVEHSQIKPYWSMAQQYVLADAMFPTEFGGSFTAHLTLIAGTDDIQLPGEAEVDFPTHSPDDCDSPAGTTSAYLTQHPYRVVHYQGPYPCFGQFNTIAEVLDDADVSWKFYATTSTEGFWEPFGAIKYVRNGPDWHNNIIAPQSRILTDAKDGNLASVDWVIPTKQDSDHPAYLSDKGPSWVASVVNAIGESSYWRNSAIIILWDDWGGFYDNAAPPQLDYRGLGMRVPCLIVSPYAKQGYVSHTRYEFASILRFIEEVNGLPAGSIGPTAKGYTDARANSLDDAFDFTQKPRKFTPITATYPASLFLREPPSYGLLDTQ
jgi:phospholipase C